MTSLRRFLFVVLCIVPIVAGCATTPASLNASVRDIIDHPREYVGKRVTVEGEVTGTFSLMAIKYFTVNDGTGTIGIISEQPLPRKGTKISVTGMVKEALSFGPETLTMIVEEKKVP